MANKKDQFFDDLIKELETKVEQIEVGVRTGHTPTRKELESFIWKTGRVIRLLVKPEASEARKIFWSECKGILKEVIVIEKFNPGVFTPNCVREDILEKHLQQMLQKLLKYTKRRKNGEITAPEQVQTMEVAAKRMKLEQEKKEEEEKKKAEEEKVKSGWNSFLDAQEKWKNMADSMARWDEEDSDPDEPCPDIAKFGECSYGRQCCFCNKV
mmetsp:Transcript_65561/g.152308  ORF Transcript_65561/g.152308 Transcript_65561/m.152308 type:complete len:212 (+) Transcript_65561:56-691(+)